MPEVMLEHRHWAPPHRWPLWKWPIKPSSQTTLDLFTRRNLKPTPKPKRNTLIQALPDLRPLEIAVRDRLYTRCERGQNWGHNSIFSGCNYRPRAQSKCFLGTPIACNRIPLNSINPFYNNNLLVISVHRRLSKSNDCAVSRQRLGVRLSGLSGTSHKPDLYAQVFSAHLAGVQHDGPWLSCPTGPLHTSIWV